MRLAIKQTEQFDIQKAIKIIKAEYGYPIFGSDLEKDEVENNSSFFVYEKDGQVEKAENSPAQYLKQFTLSFITKESKKIDIITLAENLKPAGLRFRDSEIDYGKFAETQMDASMITLNFVRVVKVCEV